MSHAGQEASNTAVAGRLTRPPFLYLACLLLGFFLDRILPLPLTFPELRLLCWTAGGGLILIGVAIMVAGARNFYRAARTARHYIAISGWQFDSNVALLRGADAEAAGEEAPLLSFLNELCERNPELRVLILAWDFSFVYSLDREWFLQWYVHWMTHESLKFCFDRAGAYDGCHHQKFVVIDGKIVA